MEGELVETTRQVIMNEVIPSALRYINRVMDKKQLGVLVYNCYRRLGNEATAEMLDVLNLWDIIMQPKRYNRGIWILKPRQPNRKFCKTPRPGR